MGTRPEWEQHPKYAEAAPQTLGQSPSGKGTRRDKALSRDSAPETGGHSMSPKAWGQSFEQGQHPNTWGHSPEQGQHPKARGHGPGDTVQHSGDSGTAADHGQQPVTLPWSGTCLSVLGTLLGTLGHCPAGNCPQGPGTVSPHRDRDSALPGAVSQRGHLTPRQGTLPQGPQDSPQRTWGQCPHKGTDPQLGTVPRHCRDSIPAWGQSPRRWHPSEGMAPQRGGVTLTRKCHLDKGMSPRGGNDILAGG